MGKRRKSDQAAEGAASAPDSRASTQSEQGAPCTASSQPEQQQPDSQAAHERDQCNGEKPAQSAVQAQPQETGNADSNAAIEHRRQSARTPQAQPQPGEQETGNVTPAAGGGSSTRPYARVRERLMQHPEWKRIIATVREMRADSKLAKMTAENRERFIWSEMDRLYAEILIDPKTTRLSLLKNDSTQTDGNARLAANSPHTTSEGGRVNGLGDLPPDWPPLPANASLPAEIGWVQANRLYVVEEMPNGGTRVHLDRAHEPAPSRAAIGWLETSIRSYAKYVEVAAKATSTAADEQDQARAERMALEDIRSLLTEML